MNSKSVKTIKLISFALLGGALGFVLMRGIIFILPEQIEYLKGNGIIGIISIIFLLVLSYFTIVALHELGHLLTGLAQGFRFYLYVVGFLGIKRDEHDRVKVYFNKDMQLFGGIAGSFPTKQMSNVLQKMAWVAAAGPITSLVTGFLFTWAAFTMIGNLSAEAPIIYKLFCGFTLFCAFFSFAIFAATTIPNRTGPFFTDRARFFRLIRGGKEAEIEQATLELTTLSYSGRRYRDLNWKQIELIQTDPAPMMRSVGEYYAYFYHLDRHEYELAHNYAVKLEIASVEMPAMLKNEYLREAAFSFAFVKKDMAKAVPLWQKVQPIFEKQEVASVWRTKAALAVAKNETDEAKKLIQKALSELAKKPNKGAEILEKELLEQLHQQLADATIPN